MRPLLVENRRIDRQEDRKRVKTGRKSMQGRGMKRKRKGEERGGHAKLGDKSSYIVKNSRMKEGRGGKGRGRMR